MEKTFQFKPITRGLGFQPPALNRDPARVPTAAPLKQEPKIRWSQPLARTPTPSVRRAASAAANAAPISQVAPKMPASIATPQVSSIPAIHFGFVYVIKRFLAYVLDSGLNLSIGALTLYFALTKLGIPLKIFMADQTFLFAVAFLMLFNAALILAQEILLGTTVFKRFFNLIIPGDAITLFLRAFFFIFSLAFFGLGIITALFHPRKRCWHDSFTDTQPLEVADL